ncbi:MAG: hypothetical protein GX824_00685 [Clostridiales bacterium]|jgi:hypothetical protein|nr:hypothetical protein [Clostridiales bacterium]
MNDNLLNESGVPLGFGMALAQNTQAMEHFTRLPKEKRKAIVDQTKGINSKGEMQAFVDNMTKM